MVHLPVLVDATSLPPNKGGVARYVGGLLGGLDAAGRHVDVVAKREDLDWLRGQAPGHRYRAAPAVVRVRPVRLVWEQVGLPLLGMRSRASVVHSPHYTFPLVLASRSVVTIHDATFFSDPAAHGTLKRLFFRAWTTAARRFARATVTPSGATASEVDRFVRSARPNVVARLGVDRALFRPPADEEVARFAQAHSLDVTSGWIAFLGTVEPRKSVPALIAAHRALVAADPATPPLLVAGGLGWDDEARRLLTAAGDRPGEPMRYLGYLDLSELAAFLGGSSVVVYPSTGEGFGLPVLEGMSCGAAVLTTRRLALPEIGGDAVAYTEPEAGALERDLGALLHDPDLRARLADDAVARSARFTWDTCASAHVAVWTS
ncbi:glycosyltransferase involved in cell wall biosynthesis [Frigoribacterium sp. PhB116]|nr:glycosyltransferase involved in cell wall biosynthesis [Frigoribacterium sp. PhB116]